MSKRELLSQVLPALASLPEDQRKIFVKSLGPEEQAFLTYTWRIWARTEQLAPEGDGWDTWIINAGRGFGKTRAGAQWIIDQAESTEGGAKELALVAKTPRDARQVMIEGESGILACSPPWFRPEYNSSIGFLTWPNGAKAYVYSAETPGALRGPQHHAAWVDEFCKFKYPEETWDMLQFGLRLGAHPRALVTTTSKPLPVYRRMLKDPRTRVTSGSLYDNKANLPDSFIRAILKKYEGTSLGEQEIYSRMLDDAKGALWKRDKIAQGRLVTLPCEMRRIVLAIDPSVTSNEDSDDTGIVIAGMGEDGIGYLIDDRTEPGSLVLHAPAIVKAWKRGECDIIVGEANNGGDLIENTLRQVRDEDDRPIGLGINYKKVHASRGKRTRAEPVALLSEQRRIKHVGTFAQLEDELCTWEPEAGMDSPNRLDAYVWAFTELMVDGSSEVRVRSFRE